MSNITMPEQTPWTADFQKQLEKEVANLKRLLPCCPNCARFDTQDEVCTYRDGRFRPPARVVAFGCVAFKQDVPF